MKTKLISAFMLASLFTACTRSVVSALTRSSCDWPFIQSVGGIALGPPQRDRRGHAILPIRCDVSGTQKITQRPTHLNSALVCEAPVVRIRHGTIFLTIRTTVADNPKLSSRCPAADLGALVAGRYSVIYRSPDGTSHPIGSIEIPRS